MDWNSFGFGFNLICWIDVEVVEDENSIEFIFEIMVDLVKVGKICYVGLLNESFWGIMWYVVVVECFGLLRVVLI